MLDERGDEACNAQIPGEFRSLGDNQVLDHGRFSDADVAGRLRALSVDLAILVWWPYIVGAAVTPSGSAA